MDPEEDLLSATLRSLLPHPGRIFIGLAIMRERHGDVQILLMKRHPESVHPDTWEIPCGELYARDRDVLQCIDEVVEDQTGLELWYVVDELFALQWTYDPNVFTIQLNFRVEVLERVNAIESNGFDYTDALWVRHNEALGLGLRDYHRMSVLINQAYASYAADANLPPNLDGPLPVIEGQPAIEGQPVDDDETEEEEL